MKLPSDCSDADQIAVWAKDAMTLLVKTGTINGTDGRLPPQDTANRAQMAQIVKISLVLQCLNQTKAGAFI